jgi:hypothetical protein
MVQVKPHIPARIRILNKKNQRGVRELFLFLVFFVHKEKHLRKYLIYKKIPVLRIHDILGWIRIQIHSAMPMTNRSGTGSGSWNQILLFSSLTLKMSAKNQFFNTHNFSKIKSTSDLVDLDPEPGGQKTCGSGGSGFGSGSATLENTNKTSDNKTNLCPGCSMERYSTAHIKKY